jgi:hypothetical protein
MPLERHTSPTVTARLDCGVSFSLPVGEAGAMGSRPHFVPALAAGP